MGGVHEVQQVDDRQLHWRAWVGGEEEEWDARPHQGWHRDRRVAEVRDDIDELRLSALRIEAADDPHRASTADQVTSNDEALTPAGADGARAGGAASGDGGPTASTPRTQAEAGPETSIALL